MVYITVFYFIILLIIYSSVQLKLILAKNKRIQYPNLYKQFRVSKDFVALSYKQTEGSDV